MSGTGEGISAEHLSHTFGCFYKILLDRKEKDGSSGLGLYIVEAIIEAMGGTVEVESMLGKGTVFILTFSTRIQSSDEK